MTHQVNHVPAETESTESALLNQNADPVVTSVGANDPSHPRYLLYMKSITLVVLALYNVGTVILLKHVLKIQDSSFIKSIFVFICEIQKAILSLLLIIAEERSLIGGLKTIYNKIFLQPKDTIKMTIPALIYIVQNNLNLKAISALHPVTYIITGQLKIFTTAIFMVILLHRRLGLIQWFALIVLFLGISIVEIDSLKSKTSEENVIEFKGLLFVIIACICSGLAGVYFEKVLKGSNVSLWIRELQLAGLSIVFSPLAVYIFDREKVQKQDILSGYTSIVWIATIVRSVGGLIVALVIKYADNILKGFASSSAIILSSIISVMFLDFPIKPLFAVGSFFVIFSIFLYSKPDLVLHVPIINSLVKNKPIFFEDKR